MANCAALGSVPYEEARPSLDADEFGDEALSEFDELGATDVVEEDDMCMLDLLEAVAVLHCTILVAGNDVHVLSFSKQFTFVPSI